MLRISLGSDHAGFMLKEYVRQYLELEKYEVLDFGTDSDLPVDYPDFIIPVAESIMKNRADCGIVFGGSGNGEAMTANKVKGIRCALCWNKISAKLAKEHNNANMISLGARMMNKDEALIVIDTWLTAKFEEGRHVNRIRKITDYENGLLKKY
jgi:ribose 5-phosphate isomerase B